MGAIGGLLGVDGGAAGTGFGGPSSTVADPQGNINLQNTFSALQGVSNGTGPNPAMAQYNKNVQDLAKQQSGAISSVQGISPALAARMIAQQGGGAMQNAAAAGATMQAQQQLGALGQMGGIAGSQANIAAGLQQNVNNANAGLAQTQMGGQQGMIGGIMSGFGATSSAGSAAGAMAAKGGVVTQRGMARPMADGGEVSSGPISQFGQFLAGQSASSMPVSVQQFNSQAPVSSMSNLGGYSFTKSGGKGKKPASQAENQGQGPTNNAASNLDSGIPYGGTSSSFTNNEMYGGAGAGNVGYDTTGNFGSQLMDAPSGMAKGGKVGTVPALVSPGEQYLPPKAVQQVQKGKNPLQVGERIPGTPKVPGNSYANDTVPKKLEAGGIVIPNSVMQSKDPANAARRFVEACISKGHIKGKASK